MLECDIFSEEIISGVDIDGRNSCGVNYTTDVTNKPQINGGNSDMNIKMKKYEEWYKQIEGGKYGT